MEAKMRGVTIGRVRRGVMALLVALAWLTASAGAAEPGPNVFCNGVRLQDEIVVVNTRLLCGTCDPESLRSGLQFETYAICDDAGLRRWQRNTCGSLAYCLLRPISSLWSWHI